MNQVTRHQGSAMTAVTPKQLIQQNMKMMVRSLPGSETARKRFQQAALSVCASPNIQKCEPTSVLKAIYQCARLNLIPDPVLHHAAIVPFRNNKKEITEATLVIEYRGLIELMKRANPALSIKAGTVYQNDDYELIEGSEDSLKITKRWWEKSLDKSGKPLMFYAVVREPNADPVVQVVSALEAGDIGDASKAGRRKGTPWGDHFERMGEKTAIKRIERFVRMDPDKEETKQFREAMEWDDRSDEHVDISTNDGLLEGLGEPSQNVDELHEGATRIGAATAATANKTNTFAGETVGVHIAKGKDQYATNTAPGSYVELMNRPRDEDGKVVKVQDAGQTVASAEHPFDRVVKAWSNVSRCDLETAENAVTRYLNLRFEVEPHELKSGGMLNRILEQISGREIKFEMYETS